MTDNKPGSNAESGQAADHTETGRSETGRSETSRSKSRRAPVTLDQKPLSVTVNPTADSPSETSAVDTDRPDVQPPPTEPATEPPPTEPPPTSEVGSTSDDASESQNTHSDAAVADDDARAASDTLSGDVPPLSATEEHLEAPPAASHRSGNLVVALLAGGIAGAAVSTGLMFLLNPHDSAELRIAAVEQSVTRTADEASSVNAATGARVAALEERLQQLTQTLGEIPDDADNALSEATAEELRAEISGLQETMTASTGEITDVGQRVTRLAQQVDRLDDALSSFDPPRVRAMLEERAGLNQRLVGLEETVQDKLGQVDIARLAAAADTQAGEVARLATRLTAAEGALTEIERRAQAADAASSERVLVVSRLAVLERIGLALARGQGFPAEIDTLSRLGVEASALAPLASAANGLATAASLAPSFARSAAGFEVEDLPADAGIVDRLAASASRIVRIRPVEGEPDASDIAGQVETFLRRNDAAAALAAWGRLPEGARAQTGAVAETLQNRVDAEAALAALTQEQIQALKALPAAAVQGG